MAANGISTLANKKLRQDTKLAKALAKREGKTVAANGTISGSTDTDAVSYRARNTLDATQLPTRYKTDNTLDNNANSGGLVTGRPWTA
jgi:hypothetical protein|tara:strand:- start:344 stop:607 length:264 start_codon:yes stop_codon:yes gene_type:complete